MSPAASIGPAAPDLEAADTRLMAYLRRLPLSGPARLAQALAILRDQPPDLADPGPAAMGALFAQGAGPDPQDWPCAMPEIHRRSMSPEPWPLRPWRARSRRSPKRPPEGKDGAGTSPGCLTPPWSRLAQKRRVLLMFLILGLTLPTTWRMSVILPHRGGTYLEMVLVAVFAILFAWISVGFWLSLAGFLVLLRGSDRFAVTAPGPGDGEVRENVRTSLVFPIYNEDMDRVCAGVEAIYRSLERLGRLEAYDVFLLSDTQDPDLWAEEESAWAGLARRLNAEGRLFYRRRRRNTKKKSGNVADFCRRWGARYTYMAMLDADSVMSGETLERMVRLMERRRSVGILQTLPGLTGQTTLHGRIQQFAARLYGQVFAAGLNYWLLGAAQYWGHNALIRVRPFMRHCALGRLPGRPPLGGEITSHDFVESALMRRAGWEVWIAYDLGGSYEGGPPNLLAEMSRDRRWCKGNMQHLRLVFSRGMLPVHRALFLNGVMAYGSALLWFLFVAVSSIEAVVEAYTEPDYFPSAWSLFPQWPSWEPWWAASLLATTGVILLLPKIMSLVLALFKGMGRLFGGPVRLAASLLLEIGASMLLAPIRMFFHSKFVCATLLGWQTPWLPQQREDRPLSWRQALRFHLGGTLLGALWGAALFLLNREFFWWITPILLPLVLSAPFSVLASRPGPGRTLLRLGLLLTPEETDPPRELREAREALERNRTLPRSLGIPRERGFLLAVLDPAACGLRIRQSRELRRLTPALRKERHALVHRALSQGPGALTGREKTILLQDPRALGELHRGVWTLPGPVLHRHWGIGFDPS